MLELNKRRKTSTSHCSKISVKKPKVWSKVICVSGIAGVVSIAAILCGFSGSVESSVNQQGFHLSVTWSQVER